MQNDTLRSLSERAIARAKDAYAQAVKDGDKVLIRRAASLLTRAETVRLSRSLVDRDGAIHRESRTEYALDVSADIEAGVFQPVSAPAKVEKPAATPVA